MREWRPMSTAPTDGSKFLIAKLWHTEPSVLIAHWDNDEHARRPRAYFATSWSNFSITSDRKAPCLGWMPLPEPPKEPIE